MCIKKSNYYHRKNCSRILISIESSNHSDDRSIGQVRRHSLLHFACIHSLGTKRVPIIEYNTPRLQ